MAWTTENDASNISCIVAYVLISTGMFLPSSCLAKIGKYIDGRDL
jgi:hypothetical protein